MKVMLLLMVMVIVMTGCDSNKKHIERQVVAFFEGYQEKNPDISTMLVGGADANDMAFEGISEYFAEELKFNVKSCKKVEKNLYHVNVEVKTINFEKVLMESYEETVEKYGEERINDKFLEIMEKNIQDDRVDKKITNCTVVVRKINGEYKIQMDGYLANALTGGMNEYLNSLQGGE